MKNLQKLEVSLEVIETKELAAPKPVPSSGGGDVDGGKGDDIIVYACCCCCCC
jgi:hypothetical protein